MQVIFPSRIAKACARMLRVVGVDAAVDVVDGMRFVLRAGAFSRALR